MNVFSLKQMPRILAGIGFLALCGLAVCPAQEAARSDPGTAGKNPRDLIRLANQAKEKEARQLLKQVVALLHQENFSPQERDDLTPPFVACLAKAARTPDAVAEVMEPAKKSVSRQVYYRRYREQWIYEAPLRLGVVVEWKKGEGLRLQSVRALAPGIP